LFGVCVKADAAMLAAVFDLAGFERSSTPYATRGDASSFLVGGASLVQNGRGGIGVIGEDPLLSLSEYSAPGGLR
jgi:hypothetical protein